MVKLKLDPKPEVPQLTWQDIISEEPLTGSHWEEVDYESTENDSESVSEIAEVMITGPVQVVSTKPILQNRSIVLQDYIIQPSHEIYEIEEFIISEADVTSEICLALLGLPSELFKFENDQLIQVNGDCKTIPHLSYESFLDLLQKFAQLATIVAQIRHLSNKQVHSYDCRGILDKFCWQIESRVISIQNHEQYCSLLELLSIVEHLVNPYKCLLLIQCNNNNNEDQITLLNRVFKEARKSEHSCDNSVIKKLFLELLEHFLQSPQDGVPSFMPRIHQHELLKSMPKQQNLLDSFDFSKYRNIEYMIDELEYDLGRHVEAINQNNDIMLNEYLQSCKLSEIIELHFQVYFMFDVAMLGFIDKVIKRVDEHLTVDRNTLSDDLEMNSVVVQSVENMEIKLCLLHKASDILSNHLVAKYQFIWSVLFKCFRAHHVLKSNKQFRCLVLLNSLMLYFSVLLKSNSIKVLGRPQEMLKAHEVCVNECYTELSQKCITIFLDMCLSFEFDYDYFVKILNDSSIVSFLRV